MSLGSALPARLWPQPEPDPAARVHHLVPVLAVALFGGLTVHLNALGLASFLTGTAVLVVALRMRGSLTAEQLVPAAGAVLLLGVVAVRGAEWLTALCVLGAWALATLALVGGRTWTGVVLGACAAALVPLRALRWIAAPLRSIPVPAASRRTAVVAVVSVALLLVFGTLFGAADPAYAHMLHRVVPSLQLGGLARAVFIFTCTAGVTAVACYLAQRPPAVDALAPGPVAPVRPAEWLVPLGLLDGLFASFVAVQLTVLFGGRDHVLRTTGLTYSAYARHGFWQLLVVTGLTMVVIAVAVRWAPRVTAHERLLVRVMLGALCTLCLVVVASALHRMSLYEQEFGWTRLRLFVTAVELALGAVLVLLIAAGVRLDGRSLPRAVVGVAAVTLLSLAAINPDAYIARHDVDRYRETGRIDLGYLSQLSADAVPALLTLPPGVRECAVLPIAARLRLLGHPWYDDNLARHHARALLDDTGLGRCGH